MAGGENRTMAGRALLTEREREVIRGEADVSDSYRYQLISRVRTRINDELSKDIEVFREHGDLLKDLRYVACTEFDD